MSVVSLQLGQCGNQIASELFSTLANDIGDKCSDEYSEQTCERFFDRADTRTGALTARTVMLDMEPKVIAQARMSAAAAESCRWLYPPPSLREECQQKRGSGNNWACGYCAYGPRERAAITERVRVQVEKCDRLSGFLTLLSLAGGTGSGLGAFASQCLRDEYPDQHQMAAVVWPFRRGEVAVQGYNSLLTLAQLYNTADALVTLNNDELTRACTRLLGVPRVGFADINRLVGHKLASFLLPAYKDGCTQPIANQLGELLEQLVSHPQYKLLTVRNIPLISQATHSYSSFEWRGLIKHLTQMLVSASPTEEGIDWQIKSSHRDFNRSLSCLAVLRGRDAATAETNSLRDASLYCKLIPRDLAFQRWTCSRRFNSYDRSMVLLSNDRLSGAALDSVIDKAWSMFTSRAYVHQYVKYGLSEDDFLDSFASLEEVVAHYKKL